MEKFKDIKGYEGLYQVSNFGRVKSLERNTKNQFSKGGIKKTVIQKSGYEYLSLCKNNIKKRFTIHQLVAIAFLGHEPNGHKLVINHIDFNPSNNNVSNLEIITHRKNTNRKHLKNKSKYVGVGFNHNIVGLKKWTSRILVDSKRIYLGSFINEYLAHLAYEQKLRNI